MEIIDYYLITSLLGKLGLMKTPKYLDFCEPTMLGFLSNKFLSLPVLGRFHVMLAQRPLVLYLPATMYSCRNLLHCIIAHNCEQLGIGIYKPSE